MQTFGEQLTAARKAKGLTQDALAKAAAVTRKTISSWERGCTIPDIDTIRRLSDILDADLIQPAEGQSAAPVIEATSEGQSAPAAASKHRIKKGWIAAGAVALACVALLSFLLFSRKPAPAGGDAMFNAEAYRQETPNEAGKAYLTFENKTWEETGENSDYQRYDFTMYEQNGVGFSVPRLEMQFEGKSGAIRLGKYGASDLQASGLDPDIIPYGSLTIDGGFPKGEFMRVGITVYGNDANGEPLTFHTLIEF